VKDGTLEATMDWSDLNGKVLLVETRNMTFSEAATNSIDFQIHHGGCRCHVRRYQRGGVRNPS
jgi:hypothetical protein